MGKPKTQRTEELRGKHIMTADEICRKFEQRRIEHILDMLTDLHERVLKLEEDRWAKLRQTEQSS